MILHAGSQGLSSKKQLVDVTVSDIIFFVERSRTKYPGVTQVCMGYANLCKQNDKQRSPPFHQDTQIFP